MKMRQSIGRRLISGRMPLRRQVQGIRTEQKRQKEEVGISSMSLDWKDILKLNLEAGQGMKR